jgi:hypothetical protein
MNAGDAEDSLSILELPSLVKRVFERAQRPLLPGAAAPVDLFVRYLRRKPGRGLAVIYHVDTVGQPGARSRASAPDRAISLTLDEAALEGAQIRFNAAQAEQAALEVQPSGVLCLREPGLFVQAFPSDAGLPSLAASCDASQGSPVFQALESAARRQLGDTTWRLLSARAEPVRYKPANRCVIRYHLVLERPGEVVPASKHMTLFGKVYADPSQARTVYALQQALYQEQLHDGKGVPVLPCPLGMMDALGLTLSEAIQPAGADDPGSAAPGESMRTGTAALQPQLVRGRGGEVSAVLIPEEVLKRTASALARLHSSALALDGQAPRTAAKEVKRLQERALLLAGYYPTLAGKIQRLAAQLGEHLEAARPDGYRPAHGGFKSSQLLVDAQRVAVVDFDGLCLADPALDVGYFMAYLRPSGLWYRRPGTRQWFEQAAEVFRAAYCQGMRVSGSDQAGLDGIVARSRLYEAALLFKIATRRVNRLNSPRQQEQAAILDEIAACLRTA